MYRQSLCLGRKKALTTRCLSDRLPTEITLPRHLRWGTKNTIFNSSGKILCYKCISQGLRPNWNVGILEGWSNGFWKNGRMVIDEVHPDKEGKIVHKCAIPLKTNIPIFHHSTIPCVRHKHQVSINCFIFSWL